MASRLEGKVALITGGTSGIGADTARLFSEEVAKVVIVGRSEEKGTNLADELGENVVFKKADRSIEKDISDSDNFTVESCGQMDILINNAGKNVDNLSLRMKEDEWKDVIDINLTSTFLLSKYAIKKMLKSKFGRVVNITSVVGHTGNTGHLTTLSLEQVNFRPA